MRSIGIVGGALAGLSAARALRQQGFDGRLTIVTDELRPPYDRPPLSKEFLAGTVTEADIGLLREDEDLGADWRIGLAAAELRPAERSVRLSDGNDLTVDGLVIATGARPRRPWAQPAGVHTLRTLDDALALRADLATGVRLVVVGAGLIGAEVASTAHGLGAEVTVVEAAEVPLAGPLGSRLGAVIARLHQANGVTLLTGVGVAALRGEPRVTGVELADGRVLDADVVVIGVGVSPNTDWLIGTGLAGRLGVVCDEFGASDIPEIVAVGDCAAWHDRSTGGPHRLEHWTAARERGAIAAASLLSGGSDRRHGRAPYFWSDQYGHTLQVAGHTRDAEEISIEEGATDGEFLAVYRRGGEPVAVLALGHAASFARRRRELATAGRSLSR